MKKNFETSYIIILGVLVLTIFTAIVYVNYNNSNQSNAYYGKIDNTKEFIEQISFDDTTLTIKTIDEAWKYCIKTTRTTPSLGNLCWKELYNNEGRMNIYKNKKYYIWIMDENQNISSYKEVNV